jgi:hypothetical protein
MLVAFAFACFDVMGMMAMAMMMMMMRGSE